MAYPSFYTRQHPVPYRYITSPRATSITSSQPSIFKLPFHLCYCFTNLHCGARHCAIYQSTRRHTARTRLHRPSLAYDSASDKHQYTMYFQRKGGRSVAHPPIQISIPQSLRLHAPLTLMSTSPLHTFTFTAVAKERVMPG